MSVQIFDCVQNSPEWLEARMGIPTSSKFQTVMAKGKDGGRSITRTEYLHKLAGEIITGEPMENYQNAHMERGHEQEDEARDMYAFMTDAEPIRVGFVKDGNKGCSPDSLIGEDGGLEIKTASPHIQIERLKANRLPPEHRHQVQGNLWICRRKWWDFVSYCPRLPLLIVRVERDDGFIATIDGAVTQFNAELVETVEFIRNYGSQRAAA